LADVLAVMDAGEVNFGGGEVGAVDRGLQGLATGGDAEDAAAGGDELTIDELSAGVEYGDAGGFGFAYTVDGVAEAGGFGIAAGGEGKADRAAWRGGLSGVGGEQFGEVAAELVEDGLGLGVAEADVEFEDFGTRGSHHEAGVEEAGERRAFFTHLGEGGEHDAVDDYASLMAS